MIHESRPSVPAASGHDAAETLAVLGPVARSSVVDAVADRLRGEILAGRLPPGSRLPSERELSLALGVNRLTLRAALGRLEALGLVATRHGAGTLVTSWRERAGLDSLAALIGTLKPEDPAWYELAVSLLELRRILATEAIALAAERHTPEQLAVIARLAGEQRGRAADPIDYARGEIALEREIIRATGNVAFELALNMFARFPDDQPEVVAKLYDRREHAHLFYELVVDLIRSRDSARARQQMRVTFEMIDADWMARHRPREVAVPSLAPARAGKTAAKRPAATDRAAKDRAARAATVKSTTGTSKAKPRRTKR
jgi:GntR family transcriptional repressor for pyruvate dehydrogenase complex